MDLLLFVVFPYLALALCLGGGLYRYARHRFSYTSRSSQLLDQRWLFWGSVPWHYGILAILLAHLFGGLFPGSSGRLLGHGPRLFLLEALGLALGLYAALGLLLLIARRLRPSSASRTTTSTMDWVLLVALAVQVLSGLAVAASHRWGSRWYLSTAAPWFWSLVSLRPEPGLVRALPGLVQLHFLTGFLVIALFPFTRLVHVVTVPLGYLLRPYQLFIWTRRGAGRRSSWRTDLLGRRDWMTSAGRFGGVASSDPELTPTAAGATLPASGEPTGRRRMLSRLGLGLGTLAGLVVAVPAVGFLLGLRRVPRRWSSVGPVDSFIVGKTVQISLNDPSPLPWAGVTARTAAWLRRESADGFIAFSVNCTHLGCPVRWLPEAELFMCPCHGGVYYRDGQVASGPPPRPLSRYPVQVRDGQVQIMTSPVPSRSRT